MPLLAEHKYLFISLDLIKDSRKKSLTKIAQKTSSSCWFPDAGGAVDLPQQVAAFSWSQCQQEEILGAGGAGNLDEFVGKKKRGEEKN